MDSVDVIYKIQKSIKKRLEMLSLNVTSGGVDNMETYKYTIGQINALEAMKQEISNLLQDKEQNDGTIINITDKTKN
mgnify:FL=1|jgi:hypothetical protein|tara:strand:- start:857 stop:1087 length:231 start_codon:yes stop_codon:yes gene_type:complete